MTCVFDQVGTMTMNNLFEPGTDVLMSIQEKTVDATILDSPDANSMAVLQVCSPLSR